MSSVFRALCLTTMMTLAALGCKTAPEPTPPPEVVEESADEPVVKPAPAPKPTVEIPLDPERANLSRIQWVAFLNSEAAAGMKHMNFDHAGLGSVGLYEILRSEHITSIESLSYRAGGLTDSALSELVKSSKVEDLVELDVSENYELSERGLTAIATSPQLANLRVLDIRDTDMSSEVCGALFNSKTLARLESLSVGGYFLDEECAREISSADGLPALKRLHLSWRSISEAALLDVIESPIMKNVESLRVEHHPDGGRALIAALEVSPNVKNLKALDLSGGGVSKDAIMALASSPALARIEQLDLDHASVGDEALIALLDSRHLGKLERVELTGAMLTPRGIERLASEPKLASLKHLDLSLNAIGDRGARALAASPHLGALEVLVVSNSAVGDVGFLALLDAGKFDRQEHLSLSGNQLGISSIEALAARELPHVKALDLSSNKLGDVSIDAMVKIPWLGNLEQLLFGGNNLTDAGLVRLLDRVDFSNLRSLRAPYNRLGVDSARALRAEFAGKKLDELWLSGNELGPDGVRALFSQEQAWPALVVLRLSENAIGDQGAEVIAESPMLAQLRKLDISQNDISEDGLFAFARSPYHYNLRVLGLDQGEHGEFWYKIDRFPNVERAFARQGDW